MDLQGLLDDADQHVVDELERMPEVVDMGHELKVENLPTTDREWHRVTEAVAVVADLKSSTQLGLNKNARSTASIYEAATGNVAEIFWRFEADFIAIQGDGAFALFWGDGRKRRATCSAITVQTFSRNSLVPRLETKWETLPPTGLKVGMACSPLLAKRVGAEGEDNDEPVWAGRAVNYAAKCAQLADRGELIVTGSMWDWINQNDYLSASCDCGVPSSSIWNDITIDKIPDSGAGAGDREGKMLTSYWCSIHGEEYCNAVLNGKRSRGAAVRGVVASALTVELANSRRRESLNARARPEAESVAETLGLAGLQPGRLRASRKTGLRGSR